MANTKDKIIVFQNQSHLIQKYFSDCGVCPNLLDLCLVTDLMAEFAINGYTKEINKRFDTMDEYLSKKYGINSIQEEIKE